MISRHQVHAVFQHTFFFPLLQILKWHVPLHIYPSCRITLFLFFFFSVVSWLLFFFVSCRHQTCQPLHNFSSTEEREKKKEESLVVSQGGLSWRVVTRESYVQAAPRTHIDSSNRNSSKSSAP